ncbi:MAG: hypothetical protein JWM55_1114 [Acidimicrobiaceae bacterium]|nr:hypothetical protein [Acidimicrobiaceae bacterium]
MALMDKMKQQAAQLAQKAQEAGKAGQAKIEDAQAKRRADGLLRELGAAAYSQRNGTATGDTDAQIERLVGELKKHEEENGALAGASTLETDEEPTAPPSGGATDAPPEGGFTL